MANLETAIMLNLHLFGAAPAATSSGPATVQEAVRLNLQSPIILAFVFGNVLTLVRSEFKFPEALYQSLVIYLLLGTGLEGGVALSHTAPNTVRLRFAIDNVLNKITRIVAFQHLKSLSL